jgi:hypothetical protein
VFFVGELIRLRRLQPPGVVYIVVDGVFIGGCSLLALGCCLLMVFWGVFRGCSLLGLLEFFLFLKMVILYESSIRLRRLQPPGVGLLLLMMFS